MKIELEGACTVERAAEIRTLLLGALAGHEKCEIGFARVTEVDLSFFQLLHAALHSFTRAGRTLTLKNDLDPQFATKASRAGLKRIAASG
ncbi:MAG: STAS domain-containing protein [Magnetococcales bacterium]|nr:STAS domain-containing protein [Magnetococcales bacterium]